MCTGSSQRLVLRVPNMGLFPLDTQTQASCKEKSLRLLLRSRTPGSVVRPSPLPRTGGEPGLPPARGAGPPGGEAMARRCRVSLCWPQRAGLPSPGARDPVDCSLRSSQGNRAVLSFELVCLRLGEYFKNKCICIVSSLLDSTYKQYHIVLVFLWLADFTNCDNLQVHPWCCKWYYSIPLMAE